jgi:hypothetical protein
LQWSIASGRLNRFYSEENLHRQYKKHSRTARKSRRNRQAELADADRSLFQMPAAGDLFHNKVGLALITAFVWFDTLPEYIAIDNGLIWLGASYLGYLAWRDNSRMDTGERHC